MRSPKTMKRKEKNARKSQEIIATKTTKTKVTKTKVTKTTKFWGAVPIRLGVAASRVAVRVNSMREKAESK
jgi:hypothetical protein